MQADDWWSHGGGTSARGVSDDTVDNEAAGSGSGSDGARRRDRHGRWRVSISDDDDYGDYYTSLYYYHDYGDDYNYYDSSGSGDDDVGELVLLGAFRCDADDERAHVQKPTSRA